MARGGTVILDFDGVIADSMPQHLEAYRRVLEPYGVEVSKLDVYRREGARSESILRTLLGERKEADDTSLIKRLAHQKQEIFVALGDVSFYPDAESFVRRTREAANKLGLVTGTRRVNLERWAGHLLPLFDAILPQEAYANDKPHPEPYQKAIERLDSPVEHCIVVENAPSGVASAKAAGAGMVIAITTTLPEKEFQEAGPHLIVADHEAAYAAIEKQLSTFR